MRYVKFLLAPTGNRCGSLGLAFANEPAVTRRTLDYIRVLDDTTGVRLVQFDGERTRIEAILEAHPTVLAYDVFEMDDGIYVYTHEELTETAAILPSLLQEYEIIVDTPIKYTKNDELQVTFLGEQQTIRNALATVPETIELSVEAVGEYHSKTERLFTQLTKRQQETLTVALDLGYFQDPRKATYSDIADELGCGPETIGEHMRKAQETIFTELVP